MLLTTHTPSSAKVKEGVELYLYYPYGPSRPVLGWTLPLPLPYIRKQPHNDSSRQLSNECNLRTHYESARLHGRSGRLFRPSGARTSRNQQDWVYRLKNVKAEESMVVPMQVSKVYVSVEVQLHAFLTSAFDSRPGRFTLLAEEPSATTQWEFGRS
jgi:hypothetical protein